MRYLLSIIFILSLTFYLISCGGGQKEEKKEIKSFQDLAENLENVAKKMEESVTGTSKKQQERRKRGDTLAIDYEELKKYLPESVKGYTLDGEKTGESTNMQGFSLSNVKADYKKGEDELEINLVDYNSAFSMLQLVTAAWGMGLSVNNDNEKAGGVKISGDIKGWETFRKKEKSAEVVLAISDRFLLTVKARNQSNTEFVKSVAKSMDINKLAKM